jgi:hypothetical protein
MWSLILRAGKNLKSVLSGKAPVPVAVWSRRASIILFISLAMLSRSTYAQTTDAAVSGQITDQSGKAVPKVSIVLTNINTNFAYTAETNNEGIYRLPAMQPGIYRVNITKDGFKSIVKDSVELHVQDNVSMNFSLQVGSVSEVVTVEGGAPLLNTTDATISTVIDRQFVENLPLNGRSFQQLITLAPGVNLTGSQNEGDLGEFSVNGQRPTSNYFTVDGVSANLGSGANSFGATETLNAAGGTNSLVSVDALQEFRILTSSFAPEYGRTPGGQVMLLTRSGTNDFHGTLFEYFRNDVFDANDWFANRAGAPRPGLRFNNYGGTVGGPILKNNTFFFFSFEAEDLRQPQFGISTVPDLASRLAAPPAIQPLLNAFPVPNGAELGPDVAEFSAGFSNPINAKATSLRIDHNFGSKLNLFGRYSYSPSSNQTRGSFNLYSLNNVTAQSFISQSVTAGLTYTISPKLVNETRANWSANPATRNGWVDTLGGATVPSVSDLFVPGTSGSSSNAYVYLGSSAFDVGHFGANKGRQVNITDNVSYALGAHQLKFGADYLRVLPVLGISSDEEYIFYTVPNAVINNMQYFGDHYGVVDPVAINFSLFGQDTWRVNNRLTLTYGLRWDVNTPPHNQFPNNSDYTPLLGNYVTGDVSLGRTGSSLWNTVYTDFAPRLGVAYQIRQKPGWETVIRGGAGVFYDVAAEVAAFYSFSEGFPNLQYVFFSTPFPVSAATATLPAVSFTDPAPGSEFQVYPNNFTTPRSVQWNISLQQGIGSKQTVSLSYVAALGQNLLYKVSYPSVGPNGYEVQLTTNAANSIYQSMQFQYQRQLSHGITATASYTWAHSLDDASADSDLALAPGFLFAPRSNWGPSDFDIRHSFKAAFSWNIPAPAVNRWVHAITEGWGTDGIVSARSALPVDVGTYGYLGSYSYYQRPDVVSGQPLVLYGPQYAGGKEFNPAALMLNPNGQGDLGRNALRGFSLIETDLSLRRTFKLTEHLRLLFRGDLFNLFNQPNFANPDALLSDGTFGQSISMANSALGGFSGISQNSIFQIGGPRTVQFSLKLQF